MAASGLFHERGFHPTAICGIFGGTAAAAKLLGADAAATASALGIAGSFAGGLFAYLDDATATKPFHPAWAAHGSIARRAAGRARRRGPARGARGPLRPLPRLPRRGAGRDPDRRAARRPRLALGDAADRVQAVPGLPLHPRLAGRDRRPRPARPGRDRGRRRHDPGGGRLARPRARRARRSRRARSTRRSSASSTRRRRCSCTAPPASPRTRTRRSPTRSVLELARRVRYETKEYPTYPAAFPGGVRITMRDGTVLEAELPVPARRPGEPAHRRRGAGEVPRERRPGAAGRGGRVARAGDPLARAARRRRRPAPPARSGVIAAERAAVVQTIREWVEREVYPVASELRARGRVPHGAGRADEGARPVRRDDPGGVRRARARPDHVRADPGRALARLDVALRRPEHALHLRVDDQDVRHRRAARALPAADGDRRDPLRVLDDRAARGLGRPGDPHARRARRRGW